MEKYKVRKYPRFNQKTENETKTKRPAFYQQARFNIEQNHKENDYLIAKYYDRNMEELKFMFLDDYWMLLERILKENDKIKK